MLYEHCVYILLILNIYKHNIQHLYSYRYCIYYLSGYSTRFCLAQVPGNLEADPLGGLEHSKHKKYYHPFVNIIFRPRILFYTFLFSTYMKLIKIKIVVIDRIPSKILIFTKIIYRTSIIT